MKRNNEEKLKETPAFINIKASTEGSFEIWPLLLLKAFANYYSAYEMIVTGNVIDFLNEVSGLVPLESAVKKKTEKEMSKLKNQLEEKDSFAIAELSGQVSRQLIIRGVES